jgi:hypothetical protein
VPAGTVLYSPSRGLLKQFGSALPFFVGHDPVTTMPTNNSGGAMSLEVPVRRKLGHWIRDELLTRLRAAGVPVGTESDPDDLTRIDDADIRFRINEVKRWGGVGYEVDIGQFLHHFKTDRHGNLDFDAITSALLSHAKAEKAAQAREDQLFSLRERLIALLEPLGVKMQSHYRGRLRRIVLTIDEDRVLVTVNFSLRRPRTIRELVELLARKK